MRLELSALADLSTLEALLASQGVDGLRASLDEDQVVRVFEVRTGAPRAELRIQLDPQDVVGPAALGLRGLVVGRGQGASEREFLYVLQLHDGRKS